ncbi:MAG: FecR domain-containing protein [Elusimicrobia bacterium]|nr:FecR domain-containing protein [Elusimicrobiota bacterium]
MNSPRIFINILAFFITANSAALAGVAKIEQIEGKVSCAETGAEDWQDAAVGMELEEGDRLKTAGNSSAKIHFSSGHDAILGEKSEMVINSAKKDKTSLDLFKGKLRSKVKQLSSTQGYEILTPQAVCAVRGTDFDVNVAGGRTDVKVYEGIVEAKELMTGDSIEIFAGQSSEIISNRSPELSGVDADQYKEVDAREKEEVLRDAYTEMFEEISKDAVMSRAAEEIKKAEYENGKAMLDVDGRRVRLEEYIVRPEDYQFKYVVLNEREDRFDFSKILFTFNRELPEDLTQVTRNMYYSDSNAKPIWILTDMISVISNTQDQINELASGGDMIKDSNNAWRHYFGNYEFSIKGYGRDRKVLWTQTIADIDGTYENRDIDTVYLGGSDPEVSGTRPDGDDTFHFYEKTIYGEGTWLAADDYLIDDDGDIKTSKELERNFESSLGGASFTDYLAKLNFERKYTSSEFGDRNIDIVFSTKLLLDSGMLSVAYDGDDR